MSVTSLKVFERECCYLHCYYVLCASTKLKRHCVCCVSALCSAVRWLSSCVWLSSWLLVTMNELCVYGSPWLAMARHVTVHSALLAKWSRSIQNRHFLSKEIARMLSPQRYVAILLRFCEKKVMISAITETKRGQKRRVSRVIINHQNVGNAITSTITTLRCDKNS